MSQDMRSNLSMAITNGSCKKYVDFLHDAYDIAIKELTAGQEIDLRHRDEINNLDKFFELSVFKTSPLIRLPVVVGAKIGGASNAALEHLARFGYHYGIAFQGWDDWRDKYSTKSKEGKGVRKDERLGKTMFDIEDNEEIVRRINESEKEAMECLKEAGELDRTKRVKSYGGVVNLLREVSAKCKPNEFNKS